MKKLFKILKRLVDDFFSEIKTGYLLCLIWSFLSFASYHLLLLDWEGFTYIGCILLLFASYAWGFIFMILFFGGLCFLEWAWEQTYEYFKNVIDEEWNDD